MIHLPNFTNGSTPLISQSQVSDPGPKGPLVCFFTEDVFNYLSTKQVLSADVKPLQTDWTQIRPNNMLALIWIQTVWHSDGIPETIFQKNLILKKISRRQKSVKNYMYPVGKRLRKQVTPLGKTFIWILSQFFSCFNTGSHVLPITYELRHEISNNVVCFQQRLRSACACAQSVQSLC